MINVNLRFSCSSDTPTEEIPNHDSILDVKVEQLSAVEDQSPAKSSPKKAASPKKTTKDRYGSPAKSKSVSPRKSNSVSPRKRILSESEESEEIGLIQNGRSPSKSPAKKARKLADASDDAEKSSAEDDKLDSETAEDRLHVNFIPAVGSPTRSPVKPRKPIHEEEDSQLPIDVIPPSDDDSPPDMLENTSQVSDGSRYVFTQPSAHYTQSSSQQPAAREEEYYSLSDNDEELSEQRVRQLKHQLR